MLQKVFFISLILAFVLGSNSTLFAQNYFFEQYSINKGLAHPEVYDLLQASDNKIWCATEGGVSVFNGTTFTNYTTNEGLHTNDIKELYEDIKGKIWVVHRNGQVNYIKNNKVYSLSKLDSLTSQKGVICLFQSSQYDYYFLTRHEIIRLDHAGHIQTTLKYAPEEDLHFNDFFLYQDSLIYLASNEGLIEYHMASDSTRFYFEDRGKEAEHEVIFDFGVDKNGMLWMCGLRLSYLENGALKTTNVPKTFYRKISFRNDGQILLSSEGNGAVIVNPNTFNTTELIKHGSTAIFVYDFIEDHENNLWIASYGQGIIKFRDASIGLFNEYNGFLTNTINDVQLWNNSIWVATENGLYRIEDNIVQDTFFSNEIVPHIHLNDDNTLFVSVGNKAFEFSSISQFQEIYDNRDYLYQVYNFNDTLYTHTWENMLGHSEQGNFLLKVSDVRQMMPFGSGYMARSISNLFYIENGELNSPLDEINKHDGFHSMDTVSKDKILVTCSDYFHIIKFKPGTLQHEKIPLVDDLKGINGILVDRDTIWATVKNRLIYLSKYHLLEEKRIVHQNYTFDHNYINFHFIDNSIVRSGMNFYIGSSEGLFVLNPRKVKPNNTFPTINLVSVTAKGTHGVTHVYPQVNDSLIAEFNANNFYYKFQLEAISYYRENNVLFKYRLKGYKGFENWSEPRNENIIEFSALPAGKYQFEFIASHEKESWNNNPVSFSFKVKEKIWRTTSFWVSILLLGLVICALLLHFFNERKLKRNHKFWFKMLNAFEKERKFVANEIHDSMGQLIMLLIRRAKSKGYDDIRVLAESALEETRMITHRLHPASLKKFGFNMALEDLLSEIRETYPHKIKTSIEALDGLLVKKVEVHVFRIVQEAINNIIKHAQAQTVEIIVSNKKTSINIQIKDDGLGFNIKDISLEDLNSIGLQSMRERAKFINAEFDILSKPGLGTTISLILPITNQN